MEWTCTEQLHDMKRETQKPAVLRNVITRPAMSLMKYEDRRTA